jgi:acyl carrier protein
LTASHNTFYAGGDPDAGQIRPRWSGSTLLVAASKHVGDRILMTGADSNDTIGTVWRLCCEIMGKEGSPLDSELNLIDWGLDSLALAELVIQLEDEFGENAITIDDVLEHPAVGQIAAKLNGGSMRAAVSESDITATPDAKKTVDNHGAIPSAIFIFAGEGAHSAGLDLSLLKSSPSFDAVEAAVKSQHGVSIDELLAAHLGVHEPPYSPVVTTVLNILQADLWRLWGHEPSYALGHSIGEIAAAYVSGLMDVGTALRIAYENGLVAAALTGKMLHTTIPSSQLPLLPSGELHLAAINHVVPTDEGTDKVVSVTLCGTPTAVAAWLAKDEAATELKPTCPWHHSAYRTTEAYRQWGEARPALSSHASPLARLSLDAPVLETKPKCIFISSVTAQPESLVDDAHWQVCLNFFLLHPKLSCLNASFYSW